MAVSGAGEGTRPTVLVVDDAAEVRTLVRARLRMSGLVEVVGEAGDGAEALGLVTALRPDLVLLDVSMPVMDGLDALPRILQASPQTRVVMYSGFQEEGLAHRALELGAAAFLEKATALDTLAEELTAILDGAGPVPPAEQPEVDTDAERRVLRDHLERFREVFEDAAIGMATVTLAGQIVRANRSLAAILERSVDELVGTSYVEVAGESAGAFEGLLASILAGTASSGGIEHDVAGAAAYRRVIATFAPVLDSERRPLYLFAQVQDVTGQRGAEEELRRSEARFRLLVDNVEDYAIFMLSTEGLVESWNAGAQRIKGYTEDEIVGRHFRAFYPRELQESGHPEHELVLALRDGHYEEEGWRIRKDGSQFWANVLITAVHDYDGRHVGYAKVTRDITERRAIQDERDASAHFLAVTAHELRSPVGVLGGTADLLAAHWNELDDAERTELLTGMSTSATRLRRLLTDLLTASRLQSSRLELDRQVVDVAEIVADSVATLRRSNPELDVAAEAAPGLLVDGDPGRLGQAVDNLLGNALAHGAFPVRATAAQVGGDVVIEVRDGGPGVPTEMRERLFERFSTGLSTGGTGLGLYIVRQLARSHDGDAWYRPPEGDDPGAFVIRVPRAGHGAVTPRHDT